MTKANVMIELADIRMDMRDRRRFRVPPSDSGPKKVFIDCHYCGYTPTDMATLRGPCPKCGGSSWERFAKHVKLVPAHMA